MFKVKSSRIVIVALLAITFSLLMFLSVFAEGPGPQGLQSLPKIDLGSLPSVTFLGLPPSAGNIKGDVQIDAPLYQNPYGCYGQTDRPHKSTHVPGTINVVARTSCAVPVNEICVKTRLYRWKCFGPFCWWSAVGNLGTDLRFGSSLARANSASSSCVSRNICRILVSLCNRP